MKQKPAKHANSPIKWVSQHITPHVSMAFQALLLAFLLLLLVNEFYKVKFIKMSLLLIVVVVLGVLSILLPSEEEKRMKKRSLYDDILVYIIGIIGGTVVFLKTKEMGWLSYVIAVVAFLLVVLLGYIIGDDSPEAAEKRHTKNKA